jgi:hypothetical protein
VTVSEIVFGALLVLGLLTLALYIGTRQVQQLRQLRQAEMPDDERRYERRKAYLRILSSVLTLVLAVLLAVLVPYWREVAKLRAEGEPPIVEPTEEQKLVVRLWGGGWIALMLVLLLLLLVAAIDLWSTRRFGLAQYRKLQADRRAMIERQASRVRRERNGQG